MSGIPGNLGVVFVGHKDEQVLRRGGHQRSFLLRADRTPLPRIGSGFFVLFVGTVRGLTAACLIASCGLPSYRCLHGKTQLAMKTPRSQ
jgi:hypothetical protein